MRRKVGSRRDKTAISGHQLRAVFHIREREQFARGVHVTQGDAQNANRHAAPADLHGVPIGAGSSGRHVDLVRNLLIRGRLPDHLEHDRDPGRAHRDR